MDYTGLVGEIAAATSMLAAGRQTLVGAELQIIKRALARITGHVAVAEMHLTREAELARAAPFLTLSST